MEVYKESIRIFIFNKMDCIKFVCAFYFNSCVQYEGRRLCSNFRSFEL